MAEHYYTPMTGESHDIWVLVIDKVNKIYSLTAAEEPEQIYRFVAMSTFLQILQDCAGFRYYDEDARA